MAQRGTSQDESITDSQATRDTAKPTRSRIRTILLSILAGLLVLVLLVTAFLTWSVMRAFPQTDGEIEVAGLQSEVTVQRDGHGIPTLTAETTDDLFRAQGFVHAQDRFWEMDFRRHMTGGRLSELFGEAQVGTDSFLRTLGWHRIAEEEVAALPPDALSYYEAYADGVNAYLEERQGGALALEYTVLGLQNSDYEPEPWTPTDSVAWLKAMAWDLRTNIEDETNRAILGQGLAPERLDDLYPDYPFDEHPVIMAEDPDGSDVVDAGIPAPATADDAEAAGGPAAASTDEPDADAEATADAAEAAPGSAGALGSLNFDTSALSDLLERVDTLVGGKTEGIGSNSWVVSGEHTDTGDPLLANDPHLGAALPSVWSQMQLRCAEVTDECPFDVAGYSFSGLPGIVIGHNQQVAWGFTNLTTDVADLYVERVIGEGHLRDGETIPFETRQETIEVAGGEDVDLEVRSTAHGPVVSGLTPEFTAVADSPAGGGHARCGGAAAGSGLGNGPDPQRRADGRSVAVGRRLRPEPAVDRAERGHDGAGDLLAQPGRGLLRLPARSLAVRRAGAEPHLCGHGREHRLPGTGPAADPRRGRRMAAAARAGTVHSTGRASSPSRSSRSSTTRIRATSSRPTTRSWMMTTNTSSAATGTTGTAVHASSSCWRTRSRRGL